MSASLLTTAQAAKRLGVSKAFLKRDRWAGAKIPLYGLEPVPSATKPAR